MAKVKKARMVKIGMSKQQVIQIMGKPNSYQKYKNATSNVWDWKEAYYYDVPWFLSSEDIIIWFDSIGNVGQISLPKGEEEFE